MSIVNWIANYEKDKSGLSADEIKEIMEFVLIWSFFEGVFWSKNSSQKEIQHFIDSLTEEEINKFEDEIRYFRNRYYGGGYLDGAFNGLKFENGSKDILSVAQSFVEGKNKDARSDLKGLFFIIYRLRNNLLHGTKWNYGMKDQSDNFRNATSATKKLIELSHPR